MQAEVTFSVHQLTFIRNPVKQHPRLIRSGLGFIIHQNLLQQPHIKVALSKITKSIGIIIKWRQFLLCNTLCTLYNFLIIPRLQCCSIIWSPTYPSHVQPLFYLQKKKTENVLRIITTLPPRTHTSSHFKQFRLLNIFHIYKYQVASFILLHVQKAVPILLSSLFNLNANYQHYSTSQRENLHIYSLKYSYSIRVQGPQIWNSIPLSLNTSLSRSNYKVNSKIAICRFNFSSLIQLCLLISQPSFFSYYVVSFLLRMSTITLLLSTQQ